MSPLRWLHFSWWPPLSFTIRTVVSQSLAVSRNLNYSSRQYLFVQCHWQQLSVVSLPTLHKQVLCAFFLLLGCSQTFTWLPVAQSVWHYHTERAVLLLYSPSVVDLHCYLQTCYSLSTTFTTCVGSTIRRWHGSCTCWMVYYSLS